MTSGNAAAEHKEIRLGLAMSGAISAGAYSAGVLDFLVEALAEWDKERGKPGVPDHRVVIAGMSGASAGAITASLGALAAGLGAQPTAATGDFMAKFPPVPEDETVWRPARENRRNKGEDAFRVLPELYDAWVKGPKFIAAADDPIKGLLDNADIRRIVEKYSKELGTIAAIGRQLEKAPLKSLLNADCLLAIGQAAMGCMRTRYQERRKSARPPAYLADNLHLFLTQANLRGVPYSVRVAGAANPEYGMLAHADRAHYLLQGLGGTGFDSVWAKQDYAEVRYAPGAEDAPPPDVAGSPRAALWPAGSNRNELDFLADTLASAAYPVGLAARGLDHDPASFEQRAWTFPQTLGKYADIKPDWGGKPPAGHYVHAALDGGALNNDPIEYMRYTLAESPDQLNAAATHRDHVNNIVVMISPFPDKPKMGALDHGKANLDLKSVLTGAVSMFIQQSRFKIEEVIRALDTQRADLWRVSPSREEAAGQPAAHAIACGLFGGFGGFLDIEFRRHDYELGRRNCQAFLKFWFGLPAVNPHIDAVAPLPRAYGRTDAVELFPIIPLYGSAAKEVQVRRWPAIDEAAYWRFADAVTARGDLFIDYAFKAANIPAPIGWGIKQMFNAATLLRPPLVAKTFPELLERGNLTLSGGAADVAAERRVLEIMTRRTIGPCLAAKFIFDNMPAAARSGRSVPSIYAELAPLALNELTAADTARLAARYGLSPATLESILDAAPPDYRIVPSLTEELNLERPTAPLTEQQVAAIVKRLVGRKLLAEPDPWSIANTLGGDQWDPRNRQWRNALGRVIHTAYPAYRFVGRKQSGTTCA